MVSLKFFDVKAKKSFTTSKFTIVTRGNRRMAITKSPLTGIKATRFVAKDFRK